MTDFKVGDEVWFFYTDAGRFVSPELTVIYPDLALITTGKIIDANAAKDSIYVYVENDIQLYNFGYTFCDDYFFKSKNEAIDAMIEHLEGMR